MGNFAENLNFGKFRRPTPLPPAKLIVEGRCCIWNWLILILQMSSQSDKFSMFWLE